MQFNSWGSVKALSKILIKEHVFFQGSRILLSQNKSDGFACVSCSWAKPATPRPFEFCQNGAMATAWEITTKKVTPSFFQEHSIEELETWSDHELESCGRLTSPLRWDAATNTYEEVSWNEAFAEIGKELKSLLPKSVVWYTSGRASLEASYMYQLMVRMYGSNNLPDSSNMCHESSSVGLKESIGVGVGTVVLDDFKQTDCIFFFGQNVGTNSPRMLHDLEDARQRGVPIITFNPLRERGLVSFVNPQSPTEMLTGHEVTISTQYHQVKAGGDIAAITGICKALFALDATAIKNNLPPILDIEFIENHCSGFDEFEQYVNAQSWAEIEKQSGLTKLSLELTAKEYSKAKAVIGIYGMGLTQHRNGVENVQMVANLLMLRGNIGKPGAGICPVRGHSNVQGQRTVGITEKPELAPLDILASQFHFEPPREKGLNTVESCEGIIDGTVKAFISLGGNFIRAVPETALMEQAWRKLRLTVNISTKLNRSHILHGEISYVLPCLGRIEVDEQLDGIQTVSVEDSTGCMHGSVGKADPISNHLLSEPMIISKLAVACLGNPTLVDWPKWGGNYKEVRKAIELTFPDIFQNMEKRRWFPGGFRRPMPVVNREWHTPNGKANFITPVNMTEDPDTQTLETQDILRLFTIRSDGQFNTTVYSNDDRFRGIYGTRRVLLLNAVDMMRLGLNEGDMVTAASACNDGPQRSVAGLRVTTYDIPLGCAAGYFPECNPLMPLWHHAKKSMVPAAKSIPIYIV